MSNWNYDKLEKMTVEQNEFTKTRLDYVKLADVYEDIIIKCHTNGDVVPLTFKDVEVAYTGNINDEIILPAISNEVKELIESKEHDRHVMHIKHFSRSISHQAWFDFLDKEVDDFVDKYPEYEELLF